MIWKMNAAMLIALATGWGAMTYGAPTCVLEPEQSFTAGLAELEDAFAQEPGNVALAQELALRYLELERPGLAVAALRSGDARVIEHPGVAHRLAQAYERSGRVLDAYATADVALARCDRSLGRSTGTPMPEFRCDARQYAILSMHRTALRYLKDWGVSRPEADPRTADAYLFAQRRARIAIAAP